MEIWELKGEALRKAHWQRFEANAKRAEESWQRRQQQLEHERLRKSGLGDRLLDKEFKAFSLTGATKETKAAYQACQDFAHNIKTQTKGLMLRGEPGTGKTHLAAAVHASLSAQLYPVTYGNITAIISRIKQSYRDKGGSEMSEHELLAELDKPGLLIIDDLGKEHVTENTKTLIYQIINSRYEKRGLLMVTSNLGSAELRERLGDVGEAIVSRLAEMCRPFRTVGKDWRIEHAPVAKD